MPPPTVREVFGYKVLAHIGEGARSQLYAVQEPKSKQVWALKHVIKSNEKDQRFLDQVEIEHQVGSKLSHCGIRGVHKLLKARRLFKIHEVALVLELVDAPSLDLRLPRSGVEAVRIFVGVARALEHMHQHGFVHSDIKPTNIMVLDDLGVKLIDLGQACPVGTVKKRIQGTPGYMAPEQAHREAVTVATDIYNFGATMYWTLVGEVIPTALPPRDSRGTLVTGALDASQIKPPVPPHVKNSMVHPLLSRIIVDCVRVAPADRPQSIGEVAHRLERLLELLQMQPDGLPFERVSGAMATVAAAESWDF